MTALRGQVTNGVHGLSPQHLHLSTSTAREGVSPRRDGSILTSDLGQFYGSSELFGDSSIERIYYKATYSWRYSGQWPLILVFCFLTPRRCALIP